MSKKETASQIANNWSQAIKDDPEQTKKVVRKMMQKKKNRELLKKSLRNRAVRWSLKKSGALETVEKELAKARDSANRETRS